MTDDERKGWNEIEALLVGMAAQQEDKVLRLARRLRPGVTAEDVRNAHDYPELRDADFNFEDGMLAGLNFGLTAIRARRKDREDEAGDAKR